MQWVGKEPPIYVWKGDTWLNEKTKEVYTADLEKKCWSCNEQNIFFTKKNKGYACAIEQSVDYVSIL